MLFDRRQILAGAGATGIAAALPAFAFEGPAATAPGDAAAIGLLEGIAEALLIAFPENATTLGIDSGKRAGLKAALTDYGADAAAQRIGGCSQRLALLRAIDRSALSPQVAIDVDVAQAAHELAADGYARMPVGDVAILNQNVSYRSTPYAVSQGSGAFAEIPDMMESKHTIGSKEDAEAWLTRLESYARALDAESVRVAADGAGSTILPGFLLDITMRQLTNAMQQPVGEWGLVKSVGEKATAAGVAGDWSVRAAAIATDKIVPALDRQIKALAAVREKASDTPGMWNIPDAEDRYAWLCEAGTTTKRTPEQIHASGLEQVKALSAEMNLLLKKQGLTNGSVGARLAELGKRPDLLFADTDAGRAELLAYLNQIVTDTRASMPKAFNMLVPGKLTIKRVPPAIEAGAPNAYAGAGAIDGSTPGNFYINMRDNSIWPRFSLPTLVHHEGIPGHVWQGEYVYKLPLIRSLLAFNAYSEGWALYAEQLADEVGLYAEDPLGRLGYLQSMNFRACRLVADTGLHHKRWTMEQAMAWFAENTGFTASQCRSELNRYCAWPGQALGYKTGHNEINRLRVKAKKALAKKFDGKAYNDLVVSTGGVPLSVLERLVDNWTMDRKA